MTLNLRESIDAARNTRIRRRKSQEDIASTFPNIDVRPQTYAGDGPDIDLELELYERLAVEELARALARSTGIEAA